MDRKLIQFLAQNLNLISLKIQINFVQKINIRIDPTHTRARHGRPVGRRRVRVVVQAKVHFVHNSSLLQTWGAPWGPTQVLTPRANILTKAHLKFQYGTSHTSKPTFNSLIVHSTNPKTTSTSYSLVNGFDEPSLPCDLPCGKEHVTSSNPPQKTFGAYSKLS